MYIIYIDYSVFVLQSGLTPMHFAAVVDKDLYERLKQAGGDCHTVDVEGNDPE